jgi:hypothetical protein
MSTVDGSFARAFLATSYLLGERGEALLALAPPEARNLAEALVREDRERRAALLAREVVSIARALELGVLS